MIRIVWTLALAAVLAGCSANPWKDAPKLWVPGRDAAQTLAAVQEVFQQQGRRVVPTAAEPGELATEWNVVPAVFRSTANRSRMRAKAEGGDGGTWLRIRCELSQDKGTGDPLNPDSTRWRDVGYDPDMEARYLFLLQRRLSERR